MIAVYIVLSVLLLIFILAMLPVSLNLKYRDEVSLCASVLGLKFMLYPKEKEKVKISDYSKKKLEKKKRKAQRKRLKLKKKADSKKTTAKPSGEPKRNPSFSENLQLIYGLLKACIGQASKYVKLKAQKIVINVGSEDAAKTALLYAAVNNSVVLILTLLDSCKRLKNFKGSEIAVNADFVSGKCSADVDISLSMRVWQILKGLFAAALKYVKSKSK